MGTMKKLHSKSTFSCLIVVLDSPNCGMLELLYAHNLTVLFIYLFDSVIGILGNSIFNILMGIMFAVADCIFLFSVINTDLTL